MSYTDKTAYAELPQWVASDKPTWLGDLNQAFASIDAKLAEANNNFNSLASSVASATETANLAQSAATAAQNTAQDAATSAAQAASTASSALSVAQAGGWDELVQVPLTQANLSASGFAATTGYAQFIPTKDGSAAVFYLSFAVTANTSVSNVQLQIPLPEQLATPSAEVVLRDGVFNYFHTSSGETLSNTRAVSFRPTRYATITFNIGAGETVDFHGLGAVVKLV